MVYTPKCRRAGLVAFIPILRGLSGWQRAREGGEKQGGLLYLLLQACCFRCRITSHAGLLAESLRVIPASSVLILRFCSRRLALALRFEPRSFEFFPLSRPVGLAVVFVFSLPSSYPPPPCVCLRCIMKASATTGTSSPSSRATSPPTPARSWTACSSSSRYLRTRAKIFVVVC